MEKLDETKRLIHKTCGFLNFIGGSFEIEEFDKRPFSEIVDTIIRNGGKIDVKLSGKSPYVSDNIF